MPIKYDNSTLKNFIIVSARKKMGLTLDKASKLTKISTKDYVSYELLQCYPNEKHKKTICEFYNLPEEKAFPKWMEYFIPGRENEENKEIFLEEMVVPFSQLDDGLLPVRNIQEEAENRIFYEEMIERLKKIDGKSRHVMEMRLGLNGYGCVHSLDKIGEKIGCCGERVRQIEKKALTKLNLAIR
jgi:DNA-directed RNA polymerase specialized sigma subunit